MTTFGVRLRELRDQRGLTSEAVGEMVGVSGANVRQWEAGEHRPRNAAVVVKLEQAVGADEGELLSLLGLSTDSPLSDRLSLLERRVARLEELLEDALRRPRRPGAP